MKQIEINGLLWDTENLEIQGKKYFTWQEAFEAAKSVGKRLPTKEELEALIDSGWEWDGENKGMWMVDRKLFFPSCGYRSNSSGGLNRQGSYVYVWSSSPYGDSSAYYLVGNSGFACVDYDGRSIGFAVRCVQDIKSDNHMDECQKIHETFGAYLRGVFKKKEQDVDLDLYIKLSDLKNMTFGDLVEMYNRLNGK